MTAEGIVYSLPSQTGVLKICRKAGYHRIVNLQFSLPAGLATVNMKLHVSYNYNAVLTFSQGTCDYVL
jgi:hypothetical protein